ncbi:MAG: ester cyclase [Anaerolineae bacterium]|jgi:steroid delta-isomerase-like uncharacterized protein
MSEELGAIARLWWEEIWAKGNLDAVDELCSRDHVFYDPGGGEPLDREGYRQDVREWFNSFVEVEAPVDDIVAEGDKVVVRWTWSGTHIAEFWGAPPTGRRITVTGINILRIAGGKIVEEWEEADLLGMKRQLGLIPAE